MAVPFTILGLFPPIPTFNYLYIRYLPCTFSFWRTDVKCTDLSWNSSYRKASPVTLLIDRGTFPETVIPTLAERILQVHRHGVKIVTYWLCLNLSLSWAENPKLFIGIFLPTISLPVFTSAGCAVKCTDLTERVAGWLCLKSLLDVLLVNWVAWHLRYVIYRAVSHPSLLYLPLESINVVYFFPNPSKTNMFTKSQVKKISSSTWLAEADMTGRGGPVLQAWRTVHG